MTHKPLKARHTYLSIFPVPSVKSVHVVRHSVTPCVLTDQDLRELQQASDSALPLATDPQVARHQLVKQVLVKEVENFIAEPLDLVRYFIYG